MAMRRVMRKSVFAAVTASTTGSPSLALIDGVCKTLNAGNPAFNNVLSSKLLFSSVRFLSSSSHHSEGDSPIYNYGKDLTELARLNNVHAIIGEGDEIDRCIEILSRGTKNKPVIIGEPSLGRSAVVEGLAQRIVRGDVPETLMNRKVISLDMVSLLSGANEIHTIVGAAGGYSTVSKESETTYQRYLVIFNPPIEERIKKLIFEDFLAICSKMISCCGISDAVTRIYTVEFKYLYYFGAIFSKEEAAKIKRMPSVLVVVPDSPVSLQHQQYPGWPVSNGKEDMMARTLVEREIREGYKENTNYDIEINDECKLKFMELKAKRTHRFIVYKIEEKQKQVIVEKLGEPAQGYEDFTACLPADEWRYAVYDYEYMTEENVSKRRIFFIAWSPDTASDKIKKTYANSKYRFKMELGGIQVELRATDLIEMSIDLFRSHVN